MFLINASASSSVQHWIELFPILLVGGLNISKSEKYEENMCDKCDSKGVLATEMIVIVTLFDFSSVSVFNINKYPWT